MSNDGENSTAASVPYIVFEAEQARHERTIKRLLIGLIVSILVSFAINIAWLVAWCQYDYYDSETTIELDGGDGGNANFIGNDGDIYNGANQSNEESPQT